MLIVEGPDGAGKTTLLNRLASDLSLEIAPRVVAKDTRRLVDLKQWTDDNLSQGFQEGVAYDRHRLISDPIYRMVMHKNIDHELYDLVWLQQAYARFRVISPIIIWAMPPFKEVYKNLKNDPDNEAVVDQILWIYHSYAAVSSQYLTDTRFFQFHYDYTSVTDEQYKMMVALIWEEIDRRVYLLNKHGNK